MVIHLVEVSQAIRARRALEEWIVTVDEGMRRSLRRLPVAARLQVYVLVTRMQACALEHVDLSVLKPFLPQIFFEYSPRVRLMLVLNRLLERGVVQEDAHRAINAARVEWEGTALRVLKALEGDNDERMRAVARDFVPKVMDLAACVLFRIVGTAGNHALPSQSQPNLL